MIRENNDIEDWPPKHLRVPEDYRDSDRGYRGSWLKVQKEKKVDRGRLFAICPRCRSNRDHGTEIP